MIAGPTSRLGGIYWLTSRRWKPYLRLLPSRRGARMPGAVTIFKSTEEAEAIWRTAQQSTRCYVFQSLSGVILGWRQPDLDKESPRASPISPRRRQRGVASAFAASKKASWRGRAGLSRRAADRPCCADNLRRSSGKPGSSGSLGIFEALVASVGCGRPGFEALRASVGNLGNRFSTNVTINPESAPTA